MRLWLRANGGPLALVVVGLGTVSFSKPVGLALIVVGVVGFVLTLGPVQRRIPWVLVRKDSVAVRRLRDPSDEEFCEECEAITRKALRYLDDRTRDAPDDFFVPSTGLSLEERHKEMNEKGAVRDRYDRETRARFNADYGGDLLWCLRELRDRDVFTDDETRHVAFIAAGHRQFTEYVHEIQRGCRKLAARRVI